jgi:hypothetical protein
LRVRLSVEPLLGRVLLSIVHPWIEKFDSVPSPSHFSPENVTENITGTRRYSRLSIFVFAFGMPSRCMR